METKICTKCGKEKTLDRFSLNTLKKPAARCKDCDADYKRQYYKTHQDVIMAYRNKNREEINRKAREYSKEHLEERREYKKQWRAKNTEKNRLQKKEWRERNIEKVKQQKHESYLRCKERIKEKKKLKAEEISNSKKIYNETHKEEIKKWRSEYNRKHRAEYRERYNSDINYRMARILSHRIREAIKSQKCKKESKTVDLLGCSIEEFKRYLETKFVSGMSWENYGQWHIDHIIPCAAFDLSDIEQQKKCFNYTNLQPLWAFENMSKNDIMPDGKERGRNIRG